MTKPEPAIQNFNAGDLGNLLKASQAFPKAFSSVEDDGSVRPFAADPRVHWLMIRKVNVDNASRIWEEAGTGTGPKSAFAAMKVGTHHMIQVHVFKLKRGWFNKMWLGNVHILFDTSEVFIGAIVGKDQFAMWDHLRRVLIGNDKLFLSSEAALSSI